MEAFAIALPCAAEAGGLCEFVFLSLLDKKGAPRAKELLQSAHELIYGLPLGVFRYRGVGQEVWRIVLVPKAPTR